MVAGDIATGIELLVINAESGGYVAAIRAVQNDIDTTLVEEDTYGGTCLNYGYTPSRALITRANLAHEADNAGEMGIHADPIVDMSQLRDRKSGVVDQPTGGIEKLCKANGVDLVEETARFRDGNTVRITHGGEGQDSETIKFEHCIIATGSRVTQIPSFDLGDEPVWSSRGALEADTVPERLVVIGGGYIRMELSTAFAKLGADVTVVGMLDDVLPGCEPDVARVVRERAKELNIDMHLGEGASGWRGGDDGTMVTTETEDGEENEYRADKVFVAVGRSPVTDMMDIENIGLEAGGRGFLSIDDHRRIDVEHIYAVGDMVEDTSMLARVASGEGIVAIEHVTGEPVAFDSQAIPTAMFTDPEIGTVGMTRADAEGAGFTSVVGRMPFRASGRALMTGHTDGFVRVVADEESSFVLGAQIVGPEASELVAELTFAIEMGTMLEDTASTIHTHPTLTEAVVEAAKDALGQAIHTLNR